MVGCSKYVFHCRAWDGATGGDTDLQQSPLPLPAAGLCSSGSTTLEWRAYRLCSKQRQQTCRLEGGSPKACSEPGGSCGLEEGGSGKCEQVRVPGGREYTSDIGFEMHPKRLAACCAC